MVKLLRIYPDMTFTERRTNTQENKLVIDHSYTPEFKIGTSVFRERAGSLPRRLLYFWKRPRNMILLVDGSPQAMSLETENSEDPSKDGTKPALAFNFGTREDTQKFIYKVVAKSKADTKPMSNTQFLIIALLVGAVLMFQFMIMKGIKL